MRKSGLETINTQCPGVGGVPDAEHTVLEQKLPDCEDGFPGVDAHTPEGPLRILETSDKQEGYVVHLPMTSEKATALWGDHSGHFFLGPCGD